MCRLSVALVLTIHQSDDLAVQHGYRRKKYCALHDSAAYLYVSSWQDHDCF